MDADGRALQLTFGTGLLGGYTTYSTFVLETIALASHGTLPFAVAYAAASVLVGFTAAFVAMGLTRAAVRAAWKEVR
jgi:fluoride exporter